MSRIESLRSALHGHRITPPPPQGDFTPSAPEHEPETDPPPQADDDDSDIEGVACAIVYTNGGGERSYRVITCKRIDHRETVSYIYAYCHERGAVRQFRVDRIAEVHDLNTGEVFRADAFFGRYRQSEGVRPAALWGLSVKKRQALRDGLAVLTFMARCDNTFHTAEMKTINDYIGDFSQSAGKGRTMPVGEIARHAAVLAPEAETFIRSIDRIAANGGWNLHLTASYIDRVVKADGHVHQDESRWQGLAIAMLRTAM